MAFREKLAWISIVTVAVIYGWYFWTVFPAIQAGNAATLHFGLMLQGAIIGIVALQIALTIAVTIAAPNDARTSEDERERLIALKGTRAAYFVLVSGALIASLSGIFLGTGSLMLGNGILLAVVVANLTKDATQIFHFRFGA